MNPFLWINLSFLLCQIDFLSVQYEKNVFGIKKMSNFHESPNYRILSKIDEKNENKTKMLNNS